MAVFTTFSEAALERYLIMFDVGELASYEAIETGIENSNYFVTLDDGSEFVLTITEDLGFDEVPFFNELFTQLQRSGLPVPNPARTLDGMAGTIFCGKPAWLFPKLPGEHPLNPEAGQCEQIGAALARLHEGAAGTRYKRDNPYDLDWASETLNANQDLLGNEDRMLLQSILDECAALPSDLPRGTIHGDLFRDNVMFSGDELTGIIDFYHACEDFLAQDIAITINDWCTTGEGLTDTERMDALIRGYESVRTLSEAEKTSLPTLRRAGALRFVLTRLLSGDEAGHLKDPEEFLKISRELTKN